MQRIFWSWQDDDSTFEMSRSTTGIIESGLYRGFDADVFTPDMKLKLIHTITGAMRTNMDRTLASQFGVIVTKQGCIIHEDEPIVLTVDPSTFVRKDLVILEHEYKEIKGGIGATVKIIKGTGNAVPALTNPNIQVALGVLTLPENCSSLNSSGVQYVKSKLPAFANGADFIEKENGFFVTKLDARNNRIINLDYPLEGKDATNRDYVDQAIQNNVRLASETVKGIIEIADEAETREGVDDFRAITPLKLEKKLLNKTASQADTNSDSISDKFITPKTLSGRFSTEQRLGIARIATDFELIEGTDDSTIVTPFKLKNFIGLSQKVIELGEWNTTAEPIKELSHNYDWWSKVVSMTAVIVSDEGKHFSYQTGDMYINGDIISVDSGSFTGPNFDSLGFNRGYVVCWVKNDIVQPPSSITANAGADQSITRTALFTRDAFFNSINVTGLYDDNSNYVWVTKFIAAGNRLEVTGVWTGPITPAKWKVGSRFMIVDSINSANNNRYFEVKSVTVVSDYVRSIEVFEQVFDAEIQNARYRFQWESTPKVVIDFNMGEGNDPFSFELQYKGYQGNVWHSVGLVNNGATILLDGEFIVREGAYFKLRYKTSDGVQKEANEIGLVTLYQQYGYHYAEAEGDVPPTNVPVSFILNGYADSVGSGVATTTWSVVSSPAGSTVNFANVNNIVTNFTANKFGTYVFRLTAINSNAQTAFDEVTFNLVEQPNIPPIAKALWGDGTLDPKSVAWLTSDPVSNTFYGWYQAQLSAAASSDIDGYIVGHHWQFNMNNAGWTEMVMDSSNFPANASPTKTILADGTYKFRVRVKDNFGSISSWSNELFMTITGSTMSGAPLNLYSMQVISGGVGSYQTQAQLSIAPIANVSKLVFTVENYQSSSASMVNDFFYKVTGAAGTTPKQGYVPTGGTAWGITVDLTTIKSSSMMFQFSLNNAPPKKSASIRIIAYDSSDIVIGEQMLNFGVI